MFAPLLAVLSAAIGPRGAGSLCARGVGRSGAGIYTVVVGGNTRRVAAARAC